MGWRASEPSPQAGSRPNEGAPWLLRCHAGLPGWAACRGCLGGVRHRMGIYLNKEAKSGFSSQNRASCGRSGIWAAFLGPQGGISLPATRSHLEPLDLIQICSRVNYGGTSFFQHMGVEMVSFRVQRPFRSQNVHRAEVFALDSIPLSLVLGPDVLRNWSGGCGAREA